MHTFKYDANIKLGESKEFDSTEYRILSMSQLQPMSIKWQGKNENNITNGNMVVFLDFYNEIVYDSKFNELTGNLGLEVLEILRNKKSWAIGSHLPEQLISQVMESRKQVNEGAPIAGEN